MKIVTICGSLKYQKEMMKLAETMALEGLLHSYAYLSYNKWH